MSENEKRLIDFVKIKAARQGYIVAPAPKAAPDLVIDGIEFNLLPPKAGERNV